MVAARSHRETARADGFCGATAGPKPRIGARLVIGRRVPETRFRALRRTKYAKNGPSGESNQLRGTNFQNFRSTAPNAPSFTFLFDIRRETTALPFLSPWPCRYSCHPGPYRRPSPCHPEPVTLSLSP